MTTMTTTLATTETDTEMKSVCRGLKRTRLSDPRPTSSRGAFIVLEGLDRSGKTTQAALLADKIVARPMKMPNRSTPIGAILNSYLTGQTDLDIRASHLLFSANRHEASADIVDTLTSGRHIVCDRYSYSGAAYSMQKGLSRKWCASPEAGLPAPDLIIYLTLDPETAATRGGWGEERYERRDIQMRVDKHFKSLALLAGVSRWATIDGSACIEDIHSAIMREVEAILPATIGTPIRYFGEDFSLA